MDAAKPKLGSNAFDPHAGLERPAKKVFNFPKAQETVVPMAADKTVAEEVPFIEEKEVEISNITAPIDQVPTPVVSKTEVVVPQTPKIQKSSTKKEEGRGLTQKIRFSANIPLSLKEKVDNAAYWVPGMTVSKVVELALEKEIKRLEKEHNDGQPFEQMGEFRFGRPRSK